MTGTPQDVAGSRKGTCARCRRDLRWILNRWPEGYICSTCHTFLDDGTGTVNEALAPLFEGLRCMQRPRSGLT